ncbi:MAG: WYL domain-containing protein [Gammaproteobacteria bacterium]|nr:WYL domain-containing protein [Gammaproteobacteria bacterium]MCZ7600398.1 WYL domain-containing protein [Gammaproteobacteria bacterium]
MDRTERFYRMQRLLEQRRCVPREVFIEDLGVSRATLKRDLAYLRDRMQVPIEWDRGRGGYFLDAESASGDQRSRSFQLPGLWFSAEEVHALLTMEQLLERLQPGLLAQQVRPLRERIRKILGTGDFAAEEVTRRIRVLQMGARTVEPAHFQAIASALLSRRRLRIRHHRRGTDEVMEREVSPQRLIHYRDNWYLDAWCHLRRALRTFAVDAIRDARIAGRAAREVPDAALDAALEGGYGIFAGPVAHTAVLRFSPVRARWVSRESWHPQQEGHFELDGAWILKLPYSDPRELVMDILKYGSEVEVLAPAALRRTVIAELDAAARQYRR